MLECGVWAYRAKSGSKEIVGYRCIDNKMFPKTPKGPNPQLTQNSTAKNPPPITNIPPLDILHLGLRLGRPNFNVRFPNRVEKILTLGAERREAWVVVVSDESG